MTARQAWNTGWRLTGVVGTAVTALALTAFVLTPDPVEGTRLAIRLTARTSLALFLLAFTASALVRLRPSPFTHWLRANRRYVGVSFAMSHAVHLAAVIALAWLDHALFMQLTNPVSYIGGGLAYAFIVLMTATSFDRSAALIGPRAWRWLHVTGMWYVWLSFAISSGKRVPANSLYLLPVAFICLALILRLLAGFRKDVQVQEAVNA
jgi:hypothetical protein